MTRSTSTRTSCHPVPPLKQSPSRSSVPLESFLSLPPTHSIWKWKDDEKLLFVIDDGYEITSHRVFTSLAYLRMHKSQENHKFVDVKNFIHISFMNPIISTLFKTYWRALDARISKLEVDDLMAKEKNLFWY